MQDYPAAGCHHSILLYGKLLQTRFFKVPEIPPALVGDYPGKTPFFFSGNQDIRVVEPEAQPVGQFSANSRFTGAAVSDQVDI
jgi:hypothetical protein